MDFLRKLPVTLTVCLALPGLAFAQDPELPEEQALEEATEAASSATRDAQTALEAYGRGVPIEALQARKNAMARLRGRLTQRADEDWADVDLHGDAKELDAFRDAILTRLRRIAPDRYQVPDEPRRRRLPEPRLKIIDVQDLATVPNDYPAPSVGLGSYDRGGGGGAVGGVLSFDDGDDWTQGVGVDADKLIELMESALGEDFDHGSIEYSAGRLICRLAPEDLKKVERVLAEVREGRGGLVDLEVRVYRMPASVFNQLRGDSAALTKDNELALARATVERRVQLISKHRVVAHDGQLVYVRSGGSRSFVADVDVNQTGVVPVINPVVQVLNEGLVVEARPIVDRERGLVMMDVALSLSRLGEMGHRRIASDVTLELPLMEIARTSSTTAVPLGRGTLLGGVFAIEGPPPSPKEAKEQPAEERVREPLTCVVYVRPQLVRSR